MGRQLPYPDKFPFDVSWSERRHAWEFLIANQVKAPEMVAIWLENEFRRLEIIAMARQAKKNGNAGSGTRADWQGYANIDLSPDDKQAIRGGVLDGESVMEILGDLLGSGHKISLTYDRDKDTVSAAATGVQSDCRNAGYTLTCYARSLSDVLTVLAYKHEVVAKGDWTKFIRHSSQVDDIG